MNKEEKAKMLVSEIKQAYKEKNLKLAWEKWCKLFDLCKNASTEDILKEGNCRILFSSLAMFEDKLVYDVTDYGKRISGYYD